jgi:hypothetical protein
VAQWLVFANGKVVGPLDAARVVRGIVDGTVPRDARVRHATTADSDWLGIDEVAEFDQAFEATVVQPNRTADVDDLEATVVREPVATGAPAAVTVESGPGSERENEGEAVWMMLVDDELRGPVSLDELRRTASAFPPGALVRRLKTNAWRPIASILGEAPALPKADSPTGGAGGPGTPDVPATSRRGRGTPETTSTATRLAARARTRPLLMASAAAVVLAIVLLASLALRPSKGQRLIAEARSAHDNGRLDEAVAILTKVQAGAPGSPDSIEAARLRQAWMIDEARRRYGARKLEGSLDALKQTGGATGTETPSFEASRLAVAWVTESVDRGDGDLAERRRLLDRLLTQFDAKSGAAQARICLLIAEGRDFPALQKCLDVDLKNKLDAPKNLVAKGREILAKHEAEEERRTWSSSTKLADWRALVAKYPDSDEARSVADSIEKAESICREYPGYAFVDYVLPLSDFLREIVTYVNLVERGEKVLADGGINLRDPLVST